MKRLASLHYNHTELAQDNKDSKSCVSPTKKNSNCETISSCQKKRDSNTNQRSKTNFEADYDEVDFQSTSDCNYKEQINETINNSSRTHKNMGSNVSTAGGGKGLSGRRTQSSSEFLSPFCRSFLSFLRLSMHNILFDLCWSHKLRDLEWIFDVTKRKSGGRANLAYHKKRIFLHHVERELNRYFLLSHSIISRASSQFFILLFLNLLKMGIGVSKVQLRKNILLRMNFFKSKSLDCSYN